jgi:ribosome assembly protein YihI (activator of Der GTPase)
LIVNNLGLLLKNLFSKQTLVDKSLDIVDRLFEEIDESSRKDEEEEGQMSWTSMRKAHLFSEVLI